MPRRIGSRYDVCVLSVAHHVADARLQKICAALAAQGLSVQLWGRGIRGVNTAPVAGAVSVRLWPTRNASSRDGAARRLFRAVTSPWRVRSDVLIVVDPDLILSARVATAVRRRKLVVDVHEDFHDLIADRPGLPRPLRPVLRAVVAGAIRLARSADLTVVADDHVPPLTARNRLVVRNAPVAELLGDEQAAASSPTAVYVGDVRRSRGLFDMLEAVAATDNWSLDLVGPVAPADRGELRKRLADPLLGPRVRLHGRQTPQQTWQIARRAWVGLSLLQDTPAFQAAMPTKVYEYWAVGLPVVVTDVARQAAAAQQSGGAVVVSAHAAASQTAAALNELAADQHRRHEMGAAGQRWVNDQFVINPFEVFAQRVARLSGK